MTLERGAKVKHAPYAFTERGAIMAANILNHALPTTQRRRDHRRRCLARVETPQPTRRRPRPDGRLAPVHRQEKAGRRLRSALFTQKRNRPEPARGDLNLKSAAAQPSEFSQRCKRNHRWRPDRNLRTILSQPSPSRAGSPTRPCPPVAPVRQRTAPKIASSLFPVDRSSGRHFSDPIFLTHAWPEKA